MDQYNIEEGSSPSFFRRVITVLLKNSIKLIKNFPANFFFLVFLAILGFAIYYIVLYWSAYTQWKQMSSYENWYGLTVLFLGLTTTYLFAISIVPLIWAILLRNSSIRDITKKETSLIKRIFVSLSIVSGIIIIFYSVSFGYEYLFPETRFYKANKEANQSKDFKPCTNVPYVDFENKRYDTIQIGEQCWIAKNLNIGDMISFDQNATVFDDKVQKNCYQDKSENCDTYGGLYSLYEASGYVLKEGVQGICPDGWRLPILADIDKLDVYLRCGAQGDDACEEKMTKKAEDAGFLGFKIEPGYGYCFQPGNTCDALAGIELNGNSKNVDNYYLEKLFVKCIKNEAATENTSKKEEVKKTETNKISISVKMITDVWGDSKLTLVWDKKDIPYVMILSNEKEPSTSNNGNIIYYGSGDSISISPKENGKICFTILGVDSAFKLIKDASNSTCFTPEIKTNTVDVKNNSLENQDKKTNELNSQLYYIIVKDVAKGLELIKAGADVNTANTYGETLLMEACYRKNLTAVKELIKLGADVNQEDSRGDTPLLYTGTNMNGDIVKELIKAGADVNYKSPDGTTPLMMWVTRADQPDVVRYLIAAGADVNAKDSSNQTILMMALPSIAPILRDAGAK
jgi:uncharacterized protein (TIGR02145 family)